MEFIPDLPLDVARLLLEEAAWSDRSTTARTLTLVSKDVRQWIDPILHHTVTLDTHTKLDAFAATVIARNDPAFFRRTVKVLTILTIDNLELGDVSDEIIDLTDSMAVILTACTGIERFAFWVAATVHIPPKEFHLLWKNMQPTHASLAVRNGANSFPLIFAMMSPSLTHFISTSPAIDPIVSVLPHTVTRLLVSVISLRARADSALRALFN
ncbi:hypothetical protein BDZ89DRAFT_38354 [Hymenopellis radicata]|nr:hypothetical protein BDZ89DRAFT_38354 [Hymenopellis radicata]